jgi:phage terminase Nu1 subunit (DNA packaging protein)
VHSRFWRKGDLKCQIFIFDVLEGVGMPYKKEVKVPGWLRVLDDGRILIATQQLANFYHVSDQTVRNWMARGCPSYARGWWDLQLVNEWLGKAPVVPTKPGEDGEESLERQKIMVDIELKQIKAERERLFADVESGKYIPRDEVASAFARRVAELKKNLLIMAKRAATSISGVDIYQRKEIERVISDEVYRFLDQYSREGVYTGSVRGNKIRRRQIRV